MGWRLVVLIVVSVVFSSAAQLLLKIAASTLGTQKAIASRSLGKLIWSLLSTTQIYSGLICFGMSLLIWIVVLSRTDVSYAYPFVALGICITVLAGHLFFGEAISATRVVGVVVIVLGVVTVAHGG